MTQSEEPSLAEPSRRHAPEVVFVPPTDRAVSRRAIVVMFGVFLLIGLIMPPLVSSPSTPTSSRIIATLVFCAAGGFTATVFSIRNRLYRRQRARFLNKQPIDDSDQRVAALERLWTRAGRQARFVDNSPDLSGAPRIRIGVGRGVRRAQRLPNADRVRETLLAIRNGESPDSPSGLDWPDSPIEPTTATIVSFGEPDVPDVGDLHFEPEIVTPTGAVWKQLLGVSPAVVLVVWRTLEYLDYLPTRIPDIGGTLASFAYLFVMAAMVLGAWVWIAVLRPTYIRMAPGVLQILQYGFARSKPTIRSYPVKPGTLAIFTRLGRHLVLTFSRGENQDIISFSRMRDTKRRIGRAWQALLSTAPTPPLSEEDLVG